MSSGMHHPAVAKHDNVQRRLRSAALKHTLKGVFKKAKFESTQSVAVLTQVRCRDLSPVQLSVIRLSTSSNVHHK